MSSSCSLSSALVTPEPKPEPKLELLVLRRSPWHNNPAPTVSTKLKKSSAYIFTARLFTRTSLDTSPALVLYGCTQPNCQYTISSPLHRVLSTGNLLKHYQGWHKGIATSKTEEKQVSNTPNSTQPSFFRKYDTGLSYKKSRKLTLDLVVSNNLPLRIVESLSFRRWVVGHNPYVFLLYLIVTFILIVYSVAQTISRRTLSQDLIAKFNKAYNILKTKLQNHIQDGSRISITTNTWPLRNYREFTTVTSHWIDKNWVHNSTVLDVLELVEPIHFGEYLCEMLLKTLNFLEITHAISIVTRDNASPNDVMLSHFEAEART
jgi:hypothetical protein